jgi:Lar family restriction alleviation protein
MQLEVYGSAPNYSASGDYERGVDMPLRPCPFCGSENITVVNTHTPSYTAECEDCGAQGPGVYYDGKLRSKAQAERAHRETFDQAIVEWNTRNAEAQDATK